MRGCYYELVCDRAANAWLTLGRAVDYRSILLVLFIQLLAGVEFGTTSRIVVVSMVLPHTSLKQRTEIQRTYKHSLRIISISVQQQTASRNWLSLGFSSRWVPPHTEQESRTTIPASDQSTQLSYFWCSSVAGKNFGVTLWRFVRCVKPETSRRPFART